jgi:hypothetical protein
MLKAIGISVQVRVCVKLLRLRLSSDYSNNNKTVIREECSYEKDNETSTSKFHQVFLPN